MNKANSRVDKPDGDPTLDDMREYLHGAGFYEADNDSGLDGDAEAAIYWFANHWHGGMSSNLYSALSCSPFNPGHCSLEDEGEPALTCYAALEARFIG